MPSTAQPAPPYRWDVVTPDQLGSLLDPEADPSLWFAPSLAACAGKVLARSGGGDLHFVGRSVDSLHDLLGGALGSVAEAPALHRLPFSFRRSAVRRRGRYVVRPLSPVQVDRAREVLAASGLTPYAAARRRRPVTFVDVVHEGGTYEELFALFRQWVADAGEPWPVIRTKVRFVGITWRYRTSPHTYRWQEEASWTRQLPRRSIRNVSLAPEVWSYLGNSQEKLTRSYPPDEWAHAPREPRRDDRARAALAEARALVEFGRSPRGRRLVARAMDGEPRLDEPWLRSLRRGLGAG